MAHPLHDRFLRWLGRRPARSGLYVPELNKKDAASGPVFGDLEEFNEPREARTASERWCHVGEWHLQNRGHYDMPRR